MASPFSIFRKYTKPMMVALCGMAILAFVVADPLMQYWSGNARGGESGVGGSQVVVSWNGGQLTELQLRDLVARRGLVMAFLRAINDNGYYLASKDGVEDLQLTVPFLNLPTEYSQGVEADVVQSQIIIDEARRMGMAVSDEAVREYLNKLGRNRITFEEMNKIFEATFGNMQRKPTTQYILNAVRDELLKQNFLASYAYALETHLPEQRWAGWLQVNDRVIVEAAGVKTSDFISKVPDPTDEELVAFYDKYKVREPMPDFRFTPELPSPIPGFKVPRMVAVQYLEGNFDIELQALKATITDEEIAKYYEENKALFVKTGRGISAEPTTDAPAADPAASDAEKELFDAPMSEKPAAESEATPKENAEPPAEDPAINSEETKPEEPAPPTDEQAGRGTDVSPFRLVSLQEAAETTEQPVTEEEQSAEEKPAEFQPTEEKPAELKPVDAAPTEEATTAEPVVSSEAPAAESTATPEKPVEYQTLDEVKEEIRTRLARDKVSYTLREKMQKLRDQIRPAYLTYFDSVLDARMQKKPAPEPPAELKDLQALAGPNGLSYHDMGKITFWKLRDSEIGQSIDANELLDQPLSFVALAIDRLKDYEPIITRDALGNRYLAMKTADVPAYVPKLEDIRDEVVQAWKREKASDLALAEAEKLAEEIEKTGETLGDKFTGNPNIEVVVTDPFAQYTRGETSPTDYQVTFRWSDPAPLVAAGPDLLTKVFQLEDGTVGVAFNHDHSIAYILRVQKHLESPEELRQNYLAELAIGNWIGGRVMDQNDSRNSYIALMSGLMQDAGLTPESWKRLPDQMNQEDGG